MITAKKLFFLVIFVACLLALVPSVVLADGGNPPTPAQYKYVPPPYKGNITVEFEQSCVIGNDTYLGCVFFTGTLKREGKEGDQCVLTKALSELGVQDDEFASHTAKDLQGRQFIGFEIGCPGLYEIIAAYGLFYNWNYTLFTVDVIVMEIVTK